jgi:hypothetical protein
MMAAPNCGSVLARPLTARQGFLVDGVPNGIRTRVFTVKG